MTTARKAGQPYDEVRQRQYMGNGITRSCGRCGAHVRPITGSMLKPYGFVCGPCGEKRGKA